MAVTNTTNISLAKPDYSEAADIAVINNNMDIIDGKLGAVGSTSVQAQLNGLAVSDSLFTLTGSTVDELLASVDATLSGGGFRFGYAPSAPCGTFGLEEEPHHFLLTASSSNYRLLQAFCRSGKGVWYMEKNNGTWSKTWSSLTGETLFTLINQGTTQAEVLAYIDSLFTTSIRGGRFGYATPTFSQRLGLPLNEGHYITIHSFSENYKMLQAIPYNGGDVWYLKKYSGTWDTTWTTNVALNNRLGDVIADTVNGNTLETGIYRMTSSTVGGTGSTAAVIHVTQGTYSHQMAFGCNTSGEPIVSVREAMNNTSSPTAEWHNLITSSNYPSIKKASGSNDKAKFTLPNSYRGFIILNSPNSTQSAGGVFHISVSAAGVVGVQDLAKGSAISYTKGTNYIEFTTTGTVAAYLYTINLSRVPTSVTYTAYTGT